MSNPFPKLDKAYLRARRQKVLNQLGDAPLLVRAAPVHLRNGDVTYPYRQDSNFHYLAGFDEPESVLLAIPNGKEHRLILFVRPRDKARETWDGKRHGTAGAKREFGADEAYPIGEFWTVFSELSADWDQLAYGIGQCRDFDAQLVEHFAKRFTGRPRRNQGMPSFIDPRPTIHGSRLFKDATEVSLLQKAADITAEGHIIAMAIAEPGMYEYEVQAELEASFRSNGSPRLGYDSIVASGNNANTLHYIENSRKMRRNELLLIDAGAEWGHFSADVTRTFPISGTFTDAQRAVYKAVLRTQKKCINAIKPGVPQDRITKLAIRESTKSLVELGVLRGAVDKLIAKKAYLPWYMHGVGHWLGMDVHDVGAYTDMKGKALCFESGMVTTVEPGLYFPSNDKRVPKELRGIGVRIEDDILVTSRGNRNLTLAIPKEVRDVEALCTGTLS